MSERTPRAPMWLPRERRLDASRNDLEPVSAIAGYFPALQFPLSDPSRRIRYRRAIGVHETTPTRQYKGGDPSDS